MFSQCLEPVANSIRVNSCSFGGLSHGEPLCFVGSKDFFTVLDCTDGPVEFPYCFI